MDELRQLALRLAVELGMKGEGGAETAERARHLLNFLNGTRDAEIISAAREFARMVG